MPLGRAVGLKKLSPVERAQYDAAGYVFPLAVLARDELSTYQNHLRNFLASDDWPLTPSTRLKPHLYLKWVNDLVRHPRKLGNLGKHLRRRLFLPVPEGWTANHQRVYQVYDAEAFGAAAQKAKAAARGDAARDPASARERTLGDGLHEDGLSSDQQLRVLTVASTTRSDRTLTSGNKTPAALRAGVEANAEGVEGPNRVLKNASFGDGSHRQR